MSVQQTAQRQTWGLAHQKQVRKGGTSNYVPQYLWYVITCPFISYMHLACICPRFTEELAKDAGKLIKYTHVNNHCFCEGP